MVSLIKVCILWEFSDGCSAHHQGTTGGRDFAAPAEAKVSDDLIAEFFASGAPTMGADQLFHAASETLEADDAWRFLQGFAQFVAEPGEKKQLEAFAGFKR
jgi:hypothetical protein